MSSRRTARVASVVREVVSSTILFELRDPRIANVTVTRVEVSGDLQHARIFVSVMGDERARKLCMHGLESSRGFLQSKLAERIKSRYTPQLRFVLDEGVKKSFEVSRIISELHAQESTKPADSETPSDGVDAATSDESPTQTQADAPVADESR